MSQELTDKEFERVLDSIRTVTRIRDRAMIGCAYYVGMSPKEVAHMHVEDVCDIDGNIGSYVSITSRGGSRLESRRLAMPPLLRALLVDHVTQSGIRTGPLFFTKQGGPATANSVKVQLWKIYRRAGFPGCSGYSGRRSFGRRLTRMAKKTHALSLKCVMEALGLRNLESVLKYLDETDQLRDLLARSYSDKNTTGATNARTR